MNHQCTKFYLPIPHLPEYSQWKVLLGSNPRRVKCEHQSKQLQSKQLQCRLYRRPITLRISLPTWTRNRQGSRLVAVATTPPRLESKCAWAGRAPLRLCGCCECEDVSDYQIGGFIWRGRLELWSRHKDRAALCLARAGKHPFVEADGLLMTNLTAWQIATTQYQTLPFCFKF